ncbi:MAG: CRISPR-associated ring nuclease [Burkholderiales bacterium]|nr:CRISPR-associated ring nuclease [Burkholderiales bacterium]
MNLLVCTLGASWAVVPEVYGFLAPEVLDLYAEHPQRADLERLRADYAFRAPDEIWLVTTEGEQAEVALRTLRSWWRCLGEPVALRVWIAGDTDQLSSAQECERVRELIYRVVLHASELADGGQLVLSLAGGRKTMSADLQSAGAVFGAHALLHIVASEPLPAALRDLRAPELFARPLDRELACALAPVVVGRAARNEMLAIPRDGLRVDGATFPLDILPMEQRWRPPAQGPMLVAEIERRLVEGSHLYANFLRAFAANEARENWASLFRLPPDRIEALRATNLAPAHRDWLKKLPKADLHRHLGGCLSLSEQRRVGQAIWEALDAAARRSALEKVAPLIDERVDWRAVWTKCIPEPLRTACAAALLVCADEKVLERNLYGVTEPRLRLKDSPQGFAAYEWPGALSGSTLLAHPAAIEPYAQALVRQAAEEGLRYVEIRGSPQKYRPRDPVAFVADLEWALRHARSSGEGAAVRFSFVWIVDRRQSDDIDGVVRCAVEARERLGDFVAGLDLAGDEARNPPAALAAAFLPAFRDCLRITIHAGEGQDVQNIWEAAYHLHADRVGHGLTLLENRGLAARFRDRGICLELCPTSNREVVGFEDPEVPQSAGLPRYPLRAMFEFGLPLAVCTDNPGISRTTLVEEYLAAARMSGAMTLWEVLALVRSAFASAFLPAPERARLIAEAESQVFRCTAEILRIDARGLTP